MRFFDQLFFIRLFFFLPLFIAPFVKHPARQMCELCRSEDAARAKIRSQDPAESWHVFKNHAGDK